MELYVVLKWGLNISLEKKAQNVVEDFLFSWVEAGDKLYFEFFRPQLAVNDKHILPMLHPNIPLHFLSCHKDRVDFFPQPSNLNLHLLASFPRAKVYPGSLQQPIEVLAMFIVMLPIVGKLGKQG